MPPMSVQVSACCFAYLFYAGSTVALSTVGMLIYCILPRYLFSNTLCCSVDLCFIAFVIFYDVATLRSMY